MWRVRTKRPRWPGRYRAAPPGGGNPYPCSPDRRYGYTVRHVQCDVCLRAYLPQHVHRNTRWLWVCGNCSHNPPRKWPGLRGMIMEPPARLRHKYGPNLERLYA